MILKRGRNEAVFTRRKKRAAASAREREMMGRKLFRVRSVYAMSAASLGTRDSLSVRGYIDSARGFVIE